MVARLIFCSPPYGPASLHTHMHVYLYPSTITPLRHAEESDAGKEKGAHVFVCLCYVCACVYAAVYLYASGAVCKGLRDFAWLRYRRLTVLRPLSQCGGMSATAHTHAVAVFRWEIVHIPRQ